MSDFTPEDRERLVRIETLLAEVVRPQLVRHEQALQSFTRERWMIRGALIVLSSGVTALWPGATQAVAHILNAIGGPP